MAKRIKKTVVPPREERLDNIGDPKTPKMGGITPKNIELPKVDDLLRKMEAVSPAFERGVRELFVTSLANYKFVSFDMGTEAEHGGLCKYGCGCPPCRRGDCGRCTVDAERHAAQMDQIRELFRLRRPNE
jgi:hypothetical protein